MQTNKKNTPSMRQNQPRSLLPQGGPRGFSCSCLLTQPARPGGVPGLPQWDGDSDHPLSIGGVDPHRSPLPSPLPPSPCSGDTRDCQQSPVLPGTGGAAGAVSHRAAVSLSLGRTGRGLNLPETRQSRPFRAVGSCLLPGKLPVPPPVKKCLHPVWGIQPYVLQILLGFGPSWRRGFSGSGAGWGRRRRAGFRSGLLLRIRGAGGWNGNMPQLMPLANRSPVAEG